MSELMRLRDEILSRQSNLNFFDANCWVGTADFLDGERIIKIPELKEYLGEDIKEVLVSNRKAVDYSPVTGNEELARMIKGTKRFFGTAVLLPETTKEVGNIEEYLNWMKISRLVAARFFPKKHSFAISSHSVEELLSKLSQRNVPLILWNTEVDVNEIEDVCRNFPRLSLILEMGEAKIIYDMQGCYNLLKRYDNFYIGMHGLVTAYLIEDIVNKFGAEHIIFGSGFPLQDPQAIAMLITHGEFDEGSKRLLTGGNIRRILGL